MIGFLSASGKIPIIVLVDLISWMRKEALNPARYTTILLHNQLLQMLISLNVVLEISEWLFQLYFCALLVGK